MRQSIGVQRGMREQARLNPEVVWYLVRLSVEEIEDYAQRFGGDPGDEELQVEWGRWSPDDPPGERVAAGTQPSLLVRFQAQVHEVLWFRGQPVRRGRAADGGSRTCHSRSAAGSRNRCGAPTRPVFCSAARLRGLPTRPRDARRSPRAGARPADR